MVTGEEYMRNTTLCHYSVPQQTRFSSITTKMVLLKRALGFSFQSVDAISIQLKSQVLKSGV